MMIAFVNGITAETVADHAVIDVGGIGYSVFISPSTADRMPGIGEPVKLYTYMSVKEDGISLYGFLTKDELGVFKMLITVSGIGPKGGLSILSALGTDDLRFAILSGDAKTIARAPGVGKKTAERLVLELHDKISNEDIVSGNAGPSLQMAGTADLSSRDDAVQALVALGYNGADAMKAVRKVMADGQHDDQDTEQILKAALKEMF